MQYNTQFKYFEPLEYNYDVCETILLWEQVSTWFMNYEIACLLEYILMC